MPWWGWLLTGTGIGTAWWVIAVTGALWLGPRLKRVRETETREP